MNNATMTTQRLTGTGAERTALAASQLDPLAQFTETDTGSRYEWDGGTWRLIRTIGQQIALLQAGTAIVGSIGGLGINVAASVDVNAAVVADVDAAVAAVAGLRLVGYSCKESAGVPAAASFRIMHGATVAGGTVMVNVNLALSTSQNQWFGQGGIACANGISIDWISGQVDVELFYTTVV